MCKGHEGARSLKRLRHSVANAQDDGFRLRPSQPKEFFNDSETSRLMRINRALADQCDYHTVQEAIFDSGNNDRVVVLPGRYKEKPSRREPTNDERCIPEHLQDTDGDGDGDVPSYEYQVTCPNDQNLIYVQGRAVPPGAPEPPCKNREGIPDDDSCRDRDETRCVRCNLQLEGSGVKPTDVIMDAGKNYRSSRRAAKPGTANGCDFEPECAYAKDVVLRVDRADGFVGRNFLTKSSTEHGVYVEETDGTLLNKTKFYWSAEYGHLAFTSDHGLYKNCDSFGAGDAAVYPGAAPESGVDRENENFYPRKRINTVVKKCDLRSSALAYSGSQGNAVRITNNEVYANTTGVVSDSISASGHPGYPPDSIVVDHNNIYSNNLDSYGENAPFENLVGLPIGVGVMWPGVNSSTIHHNHIFDNYRRGTMLLAVPDEATRGEPEDPSRSACEKPPPPPPEEDDPVSSTSCENTYRANVMGRAPRNFRPSVAVDKFDNRNSFRGRRQDPNGVRNGVDFWWDEFPENEGNCWAPSNVGFRGTHRSITSDPVHNPEVHGKNLPGFLPEECDPGDATWAAGIRHAPHGTKELELVNCGTQAVPEACPWFDNPEEPGTAAAASEQRRLERDSRRLMQTELGAAVRENLRAFSTVAERR